MTYYRGDDEIDPNPERTRNLLLGAYYVFWFLMGLSGDADVGALNFFFFAPIVVFGVLEIGGKLEQKYYSWREEKKFNKEME